MTMKLSSEFSWLQWFEEGSLVGVTQKERAWLKGGGDKFQGGEAYGLSRTHAYFLIMGPM
jgi:hypothetical protein